MRRLAIIPACLVVAGVGGCDSQEHSLTVDVITDYMPGIEVARIRVEHARVPLTEAPETVTREVGVTQDDDAVLGLRAAEFTGLEPGILYVRATLLDPLGLEVGNRASVVDLRESLALTLVISRSCTGVVCPGPADSESATVCAGGRCVEPTCGVSEGAEPCPGDCTDDGQCSDTVSCTVPICIDGSCLFIPDDGSCGPMETCSAERGCIAEMPPADATPPPICAPPAPTGPGRDASFRGQTVGVVRGCELHLNFRHAAGGAGHVARLDVTGGVALSGDFNGNGRDSPALHIGRVFHIWLGIGGGLPDLTVTYGQVGDTPLVGDWNGDGVDTVGVRRGNELLLRNSNTNGPANITYSFGRGSDVALVGDWDGNGTDTAGVRRGNQAFLKNAHGAGAHDITYSYGRATDQILVGDWNGDGVDTLGVRRGRSWILNDGHDAVGDYDHSFGLASDQPIVGRW